MRELRANQPDPRPLAVAAEALYLINLMLAPGVAFVLIAWLWHTRRHSAHPVARVHLEQAFRVSLVGGALIVSTLFIAWVGEFKGPGTWVVVILYFTVIHSSLILLGVVGLVKAMNGEAWRYPLIG